MKLQDFYIKKYARLRQFQDYWNEGHQQDKDMYPSEMTEGDWEEQLAAFEELQHEH